ncbi:ABC transporter ATP-binding protein [Glycomyces sp. TRM65418]|uniref:ABC transporter ATP-binding protein n=1 Tax=Glycomyces sp. TRM65418 TaxID=2867006 RepID=UPI001CE67E06|nr:ABC transporter ATP-binding protein [Glycomyces sp. TRM65418]MCC3763058.1 ABC transporter ATP-binding protein [Glycomyces sp. TRM65418]QZD57072.1 ABC transporter ATP-binding protein [Glycomyces sp. TRM65418]
MNAITHEPGPAVEIRDLSCRYGSFTAVDRVSFAVGPGELFALLGTNGAGKTTTIETAIGMRRPAAGSARVLGRDPYRHRRDLAGAVAVIGQETGFADDLTAAETIKLWTDLHRLPSQSDALLERVDLAHRAAVRVGALSGGERRRLDLALALATSPTVLFADEPTTGLDPASRRRTWGLLRELTQRGTAVVLTTHYLDEAAELADHVAIMDRGRIARFGTVAEITAAYEARISMRPKPFDPLALPALAGRTSVDDGLLTVRTTELQADLHRLLDWAARTGVDLADLKAGPATLDEIFAELEAEPTATP